MIFVGTRQLSGSKIVERNNAFYVYVNNAHKATFSILKYAISYICRENGIHEVSLGDLDKYFDMQGVTNKG